MMPEDGSGEMEDRVVYWTVGITVAVLAVLWLLVVTP